MSHCEEQVVALLEALRQKENAADQVEAAVTAGPAAIPLLIEAFATEERVPCVVISVALQRLGEPAIAALLTALQEHPTPRVRHWAAHTLGGAHDRRAVEPLLAALEDEVEEVRTEAAWALGEIGDRRAVEPLLVALARETAPCRSWYASALGALGDTRAVEPLCAALQDPACAVRYWAAEALERLGDPRALEPLQEALAAEPEEDVQAQLIGALGATREVSAAETLIPWLAAEEPLTRVYARQALVRIGPGIFEALVAALESPDATQRAAVVDLLGQFRGPRARHVLERCRHDPDARVHELAERGLARVQNQARMWCKTPGILLIDLKPW
jgi:HEAT repeat protein